jgi:hypothetical protein
LLARQIGWPTAVENSPRFAKHMENTLLRGLLHPLFILHPQAIHDPIQFFWT